MYGCEFEEVFFSGWWIQWSILGHQVDKNLTGLSFLLLRSACAGESGFFFLHEMSVRISIYARHWREDQARINKSHELTQCSMNLGERERIFSILNRSLDLLDHRSDVDFVQAALTAEFAENTERENH